jgi:hypothetical protein
MKTATLRRTTMGDTGTFGTLEIEGQLFVTGELPARGNAPKVSSIPAGTYRCCWTTSPKFGECYEVQGVPDRTKILFHAANHMGDKSKGFKTELKGCIALGSGAGEVNGQYGLLSSRKAIDAFHALTAKQDLELTVIDEYPEAGDPGQAAVA